LNRLNIYLYQNSRLWQHGKTHKEEQIMAEKGKDKEQKDEGLEEAGLDPKYLKGLNYRDAEEREVEEGGVKKKKKFPRIQPMRVEHVLAWKDRGKEMSIVSRDGSKYRVKK
jgi:hypothetical protein